MAARSLLDLLLPERCAGCGASGAAFCPRCLRALRAPPLPHCPRCGAPLGRAGGRCRLCRDWPSALVRVRAAIVFEPPAAAALRAWKEGRRRRLTGAFADCVGERLERPDVDALTWVPAAGDRTRWRGHHAAQALAGALAQRWGLEPVELLRRSAAGRRQQGLDAAARQRNLAGTFRAVAAAPARVCVVDDVLTTGATLAESARALAAAGAAEVQAVALARALPHEPRHPRGHRLH